VPVGGEVTHLLERLHRYTITNTYNVNATPILGDVTNEVVG